MTGAADGMFVDVVTLGKVTAAFTSRSGGVSVGDWKGLNLGLSVGDAEENVRANRGLVAEALGLRALAGMRQVHGIDLVEVVADADGGGSVIEPQCDAITSAIPGIGLLALTADCLPVAFSCGPRVAVAHAGWRGLSAGVLEHVVSRMKSVYGCEDDVCAAIGPAAGPCCYEVSAEVIRAFAGEVIHDGRMLDLAATAKLRLMSSGVAQVATVSACTICDRRFYSHRRDGSSTGRQGVIAWLNN